MTHTLVDDRVSVPREEYLRLKEMESRFGRFLEYVAYVEDIRRAREEVKQRKFVPQERLFKDLGF
jgi:hypothetical protein